MTEEVKQFEPGRVAPEWLPSGPAAGSSSAGGCEAVRCEAVRCEAVRCELTGSCEAALQLVIELAQATLNSGVSGESGVTAQVLLTRALRELSPETALKLRTLMIAGRDGRGIHAVQTNLTLGDGDAAFGAAADDAGESGPLLAEYLHRGRALACAAGLDLEAPLASWGSVEQSMEARARRVRVGKPPVRQLEQLELA